MYPNDKEKFILNSMPAVLLAQNALLAYKVREGLGYLNAVLASSMDIEGYPATCFNEYSLTCRGRNTQGVILFKNQILALIDKSKFEAAKGKTPEQVKELEEKAA